MLKQLESSMMRGCRAFLAIAVALCGSGCRRDPASAPAAQTQPASTPSSVTQFIFQQPKMGTYFRIVIWAPDEAAANDAATAAWARIDQLNAILSDYDPKSELSVLSGMTDNGPMDHAVHVSDDLWEVLEESLRAARLSDGAFDITVGPLTTLQRQSRKTGQLPNNQALNDAMQSVGWRFIKLESDGHRVQLLRAHMRLDVGGIAKGYTSDQVLKVLRQRGISRALCGAAGDIAAGNPPPGRDDWRIAIQSLAGPERTSGYVKIHDYAVSTSGDTYRFAEVNGKRYSHIIDPRTGLGLTRRIGVTTLAPQGITADWMATAISVLGPEKGIEMVERVPGAAARVVTLDEDGHEKTIESSRFKQFLLRMPASAPASQSLD